MPGWSAQDLARPLRVDGGGIYRWFKKGLDPKESPPQLTASRSSQPARPLWACPAQGSADESNSVSKLNSTDNLFKPIGPLACSASLTPHGLTQTLYTSAGQI